MTVPNQRAYAHPSALSSPPENLQLGTLGLLVEITSKEDEKVVHFIRKVLLKRGYMSQYGTNGHDKEIIVTQLVSLLCEPLRLELVTRV